MKVALLMGGRSSEREISLRTGRGIAQALRTLGHEVLAVDAANGRLLPAGEEEKAALPAEVVSHLPASTTSAIAHAGIPTPKWMLVRGGEGMPAVDAGALGGYPLVVKPNTEGSTVGLTIVVQPEDLPEALQLAAQYGPDVLIEEYIPGRELTVAVLGDQALPVVEIRPRGGHYDYESKYTAGRSDYSCPADLPEPL